MLSSVHIGRKSKNCMHVYLQMFLCIHYELHIHVCRCTKSNVSTQLTPRVLGASTHGIGWSMYFSLWVNLLRVVGTRSRCLEHLWVAGKREVVCNTMYHCTHIVYILPGTCMRGVYVKLGGGSTTYLGPSVSPGWSRRGYHLYQTWW